MQKLAHCVSPVLWIYDLNQKSIIHATDVQCIFKSNVHLWRCSTKLTTPTDCSHLSISTVLFVRSIYFAFISKFLWPENVFKTSGFCLIQAPLVNMCLFVAYILHDYVLHVVSHNAKIWTQIPIPKGHNYTDLIPVYIKLCNVGACKTVFKAVFSASQNRPQLPLTRLSLINKLHSSYSAIITNEMAFL